MFFKLLMLFTIGPLVELYILIKLGNYIGALPTILIVVATGFFGLLLARAQGFFVIRSIGETLDRGEMPANELIDGVLILLGAALLTTPGLISDTVGFLALIPGSRDVIKSIIIQKIKKAQEKGTVRIYRN